MGGLLAVFGGFFALQGAGIVMWPPESFMLANRNWIANGAIIGATGVLVLGAGLTIPRRHDAG
ncbi:hypothetical protein D6858_11515 [Tsuneonella suprasediminis]|uniref:Uncharacterized protein n=1 Tax=Tsuneonella suprasediminis TaxID=2306996 RepID=A0A419R0G5_9SPHN|nr:hypothetical protein D6858_11515 [Tsuneonella suprasediminis]